jgi:tRNA (mo5U34)-methyltransferase
MTISTDQIRQRVQELGKWFHNLDLNGVKTAPDHFLGDYPSVKWRKFADALPSDLTGKTVLDIGCNAGFYSIQMKLRGAERVLGIDTDETYLAQARFAAQVSGVEVEFQRMSVYQVRELREQFDVVLFLGVLYHLRHPLLALDLIYDVVKDLFVIQSMLRGSGDVSPISDDYDFWETDNFSDPNYPLLYFVEKRYAGDPTNWWVPNSACLSAMLRSSGFEILDSPEAEVRICRRTERNGVVNPADELREIFQ